MIFKVTDRKLHELSKQVMKDAGTSLEREMRDTFRSLPSYYHTESKAVNSIKYNETAQVVGSDKWSVAASDTGGDWKWKKGPPIDKMIEHVKKYWPDKKTDREIKQAAFFLQRKILLDGLDSHYWVDTELQDYVTLHGASGSGII